MMDTLYDRLLVARQEEIRREERERRAASGSMAPTFLRLKAEDEEKRKRLQKHRKGSRHGRQPAPLFHAPRSVSCPPAPPQELGSTIRIAEPGHPWHDSSVDSAAHGTSFKVPPVKYSRFLSSTQASFSFPMLNDYQTSMDMRRARETCQTQERLPKQKRSFFPILPPVPSRGFVRPKRFHEMSTRDLHDAYLLAPNERSRVSRALDAPNTDAFYVPMSKSEGKEIIRRITAQNDAVLHTPTPSMTTTTSYSIQELPVILPGS